MTIREITNPEVDTACAVEVMGWKSCIHPMQDRNDKTEHGWQTGKETKRKKNWIPTKNLEQAFMVVDRMIEIGWFEVHLNNFMGEWQLDIEHSDGRKLYHLGECESVPRAICEAALMAVRERKE